MSLVKHVCHNRGPNPIYNLGDICASWNPENIFTGHWHSLRNANIWRRQSFKDLHGCFLKWWYPQIIHFNRVFHYKPSILGYHYFWIHPHRYVNLKSIFLWNHVTRYLQKESKNFESNSHHISVKLLLVSYFPNLHLMARTVGVVRPRVWLSVLLHTLNHQSHEVLSMAALKEMRSAWNPGTKLPSSDVFFVGISGKLRVPPKWTSPGKWGLNKASLEDDGG